MKTIIKNSWPRYVAPALSWLLVGALLVYFQAGSISLRDSGAWFIMGVVALTLLVSAFFMSVIFCVACVHLLSIDKNASLGWLPIPFATLLLSLINLLLLRSPTLTTQPVSNLALFIVIPFIQVTMSWFMANNWLHAWGDIKHPKTHLLLSYIFYVLSWLALGTGSLFVLGWIFRILQATTG